MRRKFRVNDVESEFMELLRHLTEFSRETRVGDGRDIFEAGTRLLIQGKVPMNEGNGKPLNFYRNEGLYECLVKADHKTGIKEWERLNERTPYIFEENRLHEGFEFRVDGFTVRVNTFNDEKGWVNCAVYEGYFEGYYENGYIEGRKIYRMKLLREQLNREAIMTVLLKVIK